MKRTLFRVSVALLTFVLGVVATTLYLKSRVRDVPPSAPLAAPPAPAVASCFPGLSVQTEARGGTSYFPHGGRSAPEGYHRLFAEWYSKHLRAMKEGPFYYAENVEAERYRFLWLRTFHHPVAVRVWDAGGDRFVTLKELSGAGGYEPGRLLLERTRKLSKGEWDEFKRLLDEACYWEMPTADDTLGNDGAQWVLEGVRENRYHVVDRWTPKGGSYREACLYALSLSGFVADGDDDLIY